MIYCLRCPKCGCEWSSKAVEELETNSAEIDEPDCPGEVEGLYVDGYHEFRLEDDVI